MIFVTSGWPFMDIDAYAGCIAYAELLRIQGKEAVAASSAPLNSSITPTVRSWQAELETAPQVGADDEFVLIDLSESKYFDRFVDEARVVEVIDHHPGFEDYWRQKLGDGAKIEFIGAACTLIFEKWQQAGKLEEMSELTARLLLTGILDNTLNFKATITTDRDRRAYDALVKIGNLDSEWPKAYFAECQDYIVGHLIESVTVDTKPLHFKTAPAETIYAAQLAVWNPQELLTGQYELLTRVIAGIGSPGLISLLSIEEGKTYFVLEHQPAKVWLANLLGIKFNGAIAQADRLWLRKEILKRDIEAAASEVNT